MSSELKVSEIFTSIHGEGVWQGTVVTFIRLSGCNLRCPMCDTQHEPGYYMGIGAVLERVAADEEVKRVVITGGEPLLQDIRTLTIGLSELGKTVHLETNGTIPDFKIMDDIDWIACSPKPNCKIEDLPGLPMANEVKLGVRAFHSFCDTEGDPMWSPRRANQELWIQPWMMRQFPIYQEINDALDLCYKFPKWRYGVQLHKVLGVK